MSSDSTVEVSGLSPATTDQALESFFSFCGKLKSVTRHEKSATIVFEKASAAKTSLMLDGGTLDGSTIHVTAPHAAASATAASPVVGTDAEEVTQEDKPRTAVVAEILSHGYVLGDATIQKAIALDEHHGISERFLSYFRKLDDKYLVQQKTNTATEQISAKANEVSAQLKTKGTELDTQTGASTRLADLDAKTGASKHLSNVWQIGRSYYSQALASPHSSKVRDFYTRTAKQITDVHAEATRLAEERAGHPIQGFSSRRSSVAAPAATIDPTGSTVPTATSATTEAQPVSTAPNVTTTPAPTGAAGGIIPPAP